MLKSYRPDHIFIQNMAWRYVGMVNSNIRYGSGDVKFDRPELQLYQVCIKLHVYVYVYEMFDTKD